MDQYFYDNTLNELLNYPIVSSGGLLLVILVSLMWAGAADSQVNSFLIDLMFDSSDTCNIINNETC